MTVINILAAGKFVLDPAGDATDWSTTAAKELVKIETS